MPRIANEGPAVDTWHATDAKGNGSSTFELCSRCFHKHGGEGAKLPSKLDPYNGDPRGTMMEIESVPDVVYGDYSCDLCGVTLSFTNH